MRVPLSVDSVVRRNKEYFVIWHNGKKKEIPAPIQPYFYTKQKLDLPKAVEVKKVKAKALSNLQETSFYKYSFQNRGDLKESRGDKTFEDNIPYIIRHRIDNPELWRKFPHDKPLKFLFLDIEQKTKEGEMFPTYDDLITAISFCGNDRKIRCGYLKKDTTSDKKLLEKFIEWWENYQPDVIVVYNQNYDIPTILERCKRNRINTARLSKDKSKPRVDKNSITIPGATIYDAYDSAARDQSLSGNVINRGLKEVSNWFGFKEERKPLTAKEISDLTGTKDLVEYNKDDVRRLLICFDVYWPNIEFNADDLGIPLSEAVDLRVGNLGLIVVGDEYRKQDIIADGSNRQRYPDIFNKKRANYQGALVYLEKDGRYEPVFKADFSSMYPSIMSEFNFSPDTTTLLAFEPRGEFKIEHDEQWDIYYIPDEILDKNVVIQVSHKEGFASRLVKKFLQERSQYKKKWKETGDPMFRALSDNRKVKANGGVYGIQGSSTHAFGFAPIAIATTGIGRECARLLIDLLDELYPNSVLEVDTDGVYFHTSKESFNKKELFDTFEQRIVDKFGKKLGLSIDVDEYDKGYFYKTKNYVLQKGEKLIYHGVAMKASNKDRLNRELIHDLAVAKLNKQSTKEIVEKYNKLDFPLNYFAKNVRLGRRLNQYTNENALAPRMARLAEEYLNIKPQIGNQYYYVKTLTGYELFELAKLHDIDRDYYLDEIKTTFEMFGVKKEAPSLSKWGI